MTLAHSSADNTRDRIVSTARELLDALDRGYLGPTDRADMSTEWTARLRRSLEAHRLAGMAERVASIHPTDVRYDHSDAEAEAA